MSTKTSFLAEIRQHQTRIGRRHDNRNLVKNRVFSQVPTLCPCRYSKWATCAGAPISRCLAIHFKLMVLSWKSRAGGAASEQQSPGLGARFVTAKRIQAEVEHVGAGSGTPAGVLHHPTRFPVVVPLCPERPPAIFCQPSGLTDPPNTRGCKRAKVGYAKGSAALQDRGARHNSSLMKKVAVLLVDDHAVVRQGLRALLEAEGDMTVVGEAENGREAVTLAKKALPDVVLMDVAMPVLNGLEATRQIVRNVPTAKVLVLTSYGDDDYVTQLMEAGAIGYLVKQTAAADLLKAIRQVQKGHAFFSPMIAKRLRPNGQGTLGTGQSGRKKCHA